MREYHLDYQEGLIPNSQIVSAETRVRLAHSSAEERMNMIPFVENLKTILHEQEKYTGRNFEKEGVNFNRVQLFFMFYYSLTGLHVLHMIVGVGLLTWQFILASRGFFVYPDRYVYVEVMSLYWHFVDMVWIFLLPLLYLAGPHTGTQAIEQFLHALGFGH
jgi:cytochrome c oxidase subunit 3